MWKRRNQDRISALPDGVLLHILSFLDMEEVVRSSILSKRWRHTWTYTSTLTFQNNAALLNDRFVERVNKTRKQLASCTRIEKFKVEFSYKSSVADKIDALARFATERKVKDLTLSFSPFAAKREAKDLALSFSSPSEDCLYIVPQFLLGNSSIINLSLRGCKVVPGGDISWTSLRALSIAGGPLDDHTIVKILSSSPMLEDLKLSATNGLHHLRINSQTLRRLEIQLNTEEADDLLEISAPTLKELCLSGYLLTRNLLVCAPSLVRGEVKFSHCLGDNKDDRIVIAQFFRSFCQVKELELNCRSLEDLILLEAKGLLSPLSSLTCLKLNDADIDKRAVPSIIILLICSPNLEKLVFTKTQNNSEPFGEQLENLSSEQLENYWNWSISRRWNQRFPLPHLKTVKFIGFTGPELDEFTGTLINFIFGEF